MSDLTIINLDGLGYQFDGFYGDSRSIEGDGILNNYIYVHPTALGTNYGYFFGADFFEEITVFIPEDWSVNVVDVTLIDPGYDAYRFYDGSGTRAVGIIAPRADITVVNLCFTKGALIDTPDGPRPVDTLAAGDLVTTRDHGAQPLRWIGRSILGAETLAAFPDMMPIRIAAGALGDHAETLVSPAHRMLVSGWRAEALFGVTEMLASAASLVNDTTIRRADVDEVEYIHLLFDGHELVRADGAWSESLQPVSACLPEATRAEVLELFPEFETGACPSPTRPALEAGAVRLLGL